MSILIAKSVAHLASAGSDPANAPDATQKAEIERDVLGAGVSRLYANTIVATIGSILTGMVLWVMFYRHTADPWVLVWAVVLHISQALRLAMLIARRRDKDLRTPVMVWRRRYRVTLLVAACAWAAAPAMLLPANDVAYASMLMLVMLGVAAGGISTIAADRTAIYLWIVPMALPLPFMLLLHPSPEYVALAAFSIAFTAVNLRFLLAQNRVLTAALQARFENVALVKQLHQQMTLTAEASRDKSRFLAAASHDLRQPLHALSFFGAALENRMADSIDHPLIYNMMRSIEALDKSFGAILDISRLDARAIEPHVQSFPIRDLFRRLQMNFAGLAEEAGLQLRFCPGGKVVKSDPQLLERILANLIQNGIRYCKSGGLIVLARNWKGGINIEVWDTGIGINDDELPKIFGEFYQVANPERDRTKGLGMGLAIVKRLTLLLDHKLTVKSRLGRGSLFRLWIEGPDLDQMEEFTVGAETVPGHIDDSRTLLFIDDEEAIRTSVLHLLTQWGYTVLAASTIDEAHKLALEHEGLIDIVISDLRLRGGEDGIRAIERVRQACGFDVPALLVTGDTSPEQVKRVHESGHIVLFKPVQPKELFAVLKRLS